MKYFIIIIACITSHTYGFEESICESNTGKEAIFKVNQQTENPKVVCEVLYTFNGLEATLLSDKKQLKNCEVRANDLLEMHRDRWGWQCQALAEYVQAEPTDILASQLDPIVQKEIYEYKQAAIIQGMIASASSLRSRIQEYRLRNSGMPTSLEDLQLNREDMRDSRHLSDLTIGTNGNIFIKGNEEIGTDTIVRIGFKETLGGLNTEMVCHVNKPIKRVDYCDYDSTIRFPL